MERRSFLKASAALGCAATVTGCKTSSDEPNKVPPTPPVADEQINWSSCTCNCGASCALKVYSRDGVVTRVETDDTTDDSPGLEQARACLRGRSSKQKMYAADRLKYPMKRVGKRGEGKFIRISWDEAYSTIAKELKRVIDTYGNPAVYCQYASGTNQLRVGGREQVMKLLNMLGGSLKSHGTYSASQLEMSSFYTFGGMQSSGYEHMRESDLVLSFGFNPCETRMSGTGGGVDLTQSSFTSEMIMIDPRYSESMLGKEDTWVPIRVGTDAALCEAIAYEIISTDRHDKAFLAKYCVGFDAATLPEGAKANSDYYSHIMGLGDDQTAKTPEWASAITGIPTEKIRYIANRLVNADKPYVVQGWGVQRHANGEQNSRAIYMLPLLVGKVGKPGTNTGNFPGHSHSLGLLPVGTNDVAATIPCFLWTDAVTHGEEMTAIEHGIQGVEQLDTSIKFIWNYAGNTMINQHSDSFRTKEILEDETLCEFILVHDVQMTPSAMFADILLPDIMDLEQHDIVGNGGTGMETIIAMTSSLVPTFECKSAFDVCSGIAREMGIEAEFTEGKTYQEWVEEVYETSRQRNAQLPHYQDMCDKGIAKLSRPLGEPALAAFVNDPQSNPLNTPSGKIEIYSQTLQDMSDTWILPDGDIIPAIPKYYPAWEGAEDTEGKVKFPLQLIGHHTKGRTHSSFHNIPWLREAVEDALWINPLDATRRNIQSGDKIKVSNDRGVVHTIAKVTPRIMPGIISLAQGAWFAPVDGIDAGGCINSLTSLRPSPLTKGNPQHTNLVQVVKL